MKFKTKPFPHQLEEWSRSHDEPVRAILWEQGTGKTKLTLDTAASLAQEGKIDAILVVAPNGVHENWVSDEIPKHWPFYPHLFTFVWSSKRARTKTHQREAARVFETSCFPFVAMSYDAFMTKPGGQFAKKLLHKRRVFYVLDESQRIKTPRAKRTKAIVASGRRANYKRILTGTPITCSPFDIYTQLRFLDDRFWFDRGFASYQAFKTYFGIWKEFVTEKGQRFEKAVDFKNLDELCEIVAGISSRITKEDAGLNLPPKVYTRRYFDLTSEQVRLYTELTNKMMTILKSGELVTTPIKLTLLLRLQQIICGYLPSDDCENLNVLDENPRLKLLLDTLEDVTGQAIIWARFRQDINQIVDALVAEKYSVVRYDGFVNDRDRKRAKDEFQGGTVQYFVGNPAAAGVGLTLHAAKDVLYYSNSFNWEHRSQSEDRAHRIGQDGQILSVDEDGNPIYGVRYTDLLAAGTVDIKILNNLLEKQSIAAAVTGDKLESWIKL